MSTSPAKPGPDSLRPEVQAFEPYSAGLSIDEIREKYGLSQVIKLASNENPLGVSPVVQRVIADKADTCFRYAQVGNPRLVAAIAEFLAPWNITPQHVVVGNGSDEIIDLLIRLRARPGQDNIIAFKPCFSMYTLQSKLCGVEFRQTPLNQDFSFPWDKFLDLADENTALAFVTTPDNPSGFTPPVSELESLARALPENCILAIDEAYMDFCADQTAHSLLPRLEEFPNVVVMRTFSKLYGLAGLRLGYGVMAPWLADYLWRIRPPFSVNILAEEAGMAVLKDTVFVEETLRVVNQGRDFLTQSLTGMGCTVAPSQANFMLFRLPPGAPEAKAVFEALLAKGVIIRPLTSYGLPDSLRLTIGTEQENRTFVRCFQEVLGG
ncbi:MAG: histidinol-phosphate transaminase [Desulfovibrio sp.]|nr:MAG: histidinol-phosphate transaminase [Desulfovibrio sp.]